MNSIMSVLCPLCGGKTQKLIDGRDRLTHKPGEFQVRRCNQCKVLFTYPPLIETEIGEYYSEEYNLGEGKRVAAIPLPEMKERHKRMLREVTRTKFNLITEYGGVGSLLDIGCNAGYFLYGMKMLGWKTLYGLEPSPIAANFVERSLGIKVWNRMFPNTELMVESQFDVITMWHVFEHLPDPPKAFEAVRKLLSPQGLCIIDIPNPDSLDMRIFGAAWYGFDVPRHYFTYPPPVFRKIAQESGFDILGERELDDLHSVILMNITFALDGTRFMRLWRRLARILSIGVVGKSLRPAYYGLRLIGLSPSRVYVLKVAN
jgi:SAM-dependent methyltransferase